MAWTAESDYGAYQVVELDLDEHDELIERKLVALPFGRILEAVDHIKTVISRYEHSGYNENDGSWWAYADNGDRTRFVIEGI
jgi:hypothetical protein